MQRLIATPTGSRSITSEVTPRLLVQFWDNISAIPLDVQVCLDSWSTLEDVGFKRLLFDDVSARRFIAEHFSDRHVLAFKNCHHPAMRADYFRLCFILKVGGFYVDADDVYRGGSVDGLVSDGRLKLQPLCYDITTDSMLDPSGSASAGEDGSRIYYVNNNPLIAPAGHPIIASALDRATSFVLSAGGRSRDIQSLTGPGNLTATLVKHAVARQREGLTYDFELITDWETVATSRWPLAYRSDDRNWRRWVRSNG